MNPSHLRHSSPVILTIALVILLSVFAASSLSAQDGSTLSIPAIGIKTQVVEIYIKAFPDGSITWDTDSLGTKAGHLDQMPWFGSGSNIPLGGHSELKNRQPGIFVHLHDIQVGDEIIVSSGGAEFRYMVSEIRRVPQDDLSILVPSASERLTLFTCDATSYDAASGTYSYRVVVIAERVA